jgi:hypothetical protein
VWDGKQYYYFFGNNGCVQYVTTKPIGKAAPPRFPINEGTFTMGPTGAVVIDWNPAGGGSTRETFIKGGVGSTQMNGKSDRYADSPLVAKKM